MQTRDEIENDVNNLSTAVEAEKAKLTDLIGEIDFTDKNILAALNKKLQDIQQQPLESFSNANERKLQIVTGGHSPTDLARSVQLQSLLTQCGELSKGINII